MKGDKQKWLVITLFIIAVLSGCSSDNNEENNIYNVTKPTEESTEEAATETGEFLEDTEIETVATLEELGLKPSDIHEYLVKPYSEEGNEIVEGWYNEQKERYNELEDKQYYEEYVANRDTEIEELRKKLYGEYGVVQTNPLIIKVRDKDEMSLRYADTYSYITEKGRLLKYYDEWYEISGYKSYKSNWFCSGEFDWTYSIDEDDCIGMLRYYFDGFTRRIADDFFGHTVDENKIRRDIENSNSEGIKGEWITYDCEGLTVNVYIRVDNPENVECLEKATIDLHFYCMFDSERCVTARCDFSIPDEDIESYYKEESLREMFSIRKYQ